MQYPPPHAIPRQATRPSQGRNLLLVLWGIGFLGVLSLLLAITLLVLILYGGGDILPNVKAAGITVGGLNRSEAANTLSSSWQQQGILLRDEDRIWNENPANLGLNIDAETTAQAAYNWGRSDGGLLNGVAALFGQAEVEPHLNVDLAQARARLEEIRPILEEPAKNAGLQVVGGQIQTTPPLEGRALDIDATLAQLQTEAASELADGAIDLVMLPIAPAVTDASPLLQEAQQLLNQPLNIEAYDPIHNESLFWSLSVEQWGAWLLAIPDPANPIGLTFSLDQTALHDYLTARNNELELPRYIRVEEAVKAVNAALASKNLNTWLRVYHQPTTYAVQAGDSISSIGYDLGIPYPWIQAANPDIGALSVGQIINIPSKDDLLPLPIIKNKRIVVSISQQELWAYENGQLKWNWRISTGIARSPTSPGIFQVQSHEINAYAAQWNLYMPHFMGVYNPGPNAGVMNGFHGFPTDASGGYLLWTNNLGTPATYGCILLSLENAQALYDWAEEGVVVEIQR